MYSSANPKYSITFKICTNYSRCQKKTKTNICTVRVPYYSVLNLYLHIPRTYMDPGVLYEQPFKHLHLVLGNPQVVQRDLKKL